MKRADSERLWAERIAGWKASGLISAFQVDRVLLRKVDLVCAVHRSLWPQRLECLDLCALLMGSLRSVARYPCDVS